MCGDPPNIIIGTSLGFSFFDFLTNTGFCAAISLAVSVIFLYFAFRKEITGGKGEPVDMSKFPKPSEAITNKRDFIISSITKVENKLNSHLFLDIIFEYDYRSVVPEGKSHYDVATEIALRLKF